MTEPTSRRDVGFRARLGRALNHLVTRWATPGAGRVAVCSPLVGLVAGLGAVAFLLPLNWMIDHVLGTGMGLHMPPTGEGVPVGPSAVFGRFGPWWMVLLIPTAGGLLSGLLVFSFAPEAEGHGTDALIRAFHRGAGKIRSRVPLVKGLASVITIGSGGSAGQEGPIAQIGAGFGSALASLLRLTANERRLLMLAGAAGGVGAIFRAPLGGALFACEVLYMTTAMEAAALLPCLASSIVAYSTFALFITPQPIFAVPALAFRGFRELPLFALLAVACAGVGWLYIRLFYGIRDRIFHPLPIPRHVKPAIGGLLVGLIALKFPEVMTGGYGWVQWGAIGLPPELVGRAAGSGFDAPRLGMASLLTLVVVKILATGLTISSGGSGGVFGPSIFIGGMVGGMVGQGLREIGLNVNPAAYALVGMGGFFAGVSKTPLTSILMVCEMSGNYSLLVPLMLVVALHLGLSRRWTLYEEQVPSPIDSPAHQGDFVIDVLERLKVGDLAIRAEGLEPIPEAMPFAQVVRRVAGSGEELFPVVDASGRLTGIFNLRDLRLALLGSDWGPLVIAADLATRPVLAVRPGDDLHTALRRMTELNADEIPVVGADDSSRLIGFLSRKDLVAAYSAQVDAMKSPEGTARSLGA